MHYYDLEANWDVVKPHLDSDTVRQKLEIDFGRFALNAMGIPFEGYPSDFELQTDWREGKDPSEWPEYWKYVCQGACHYLVNFTLALANASVPSHSWRIIRSEIHSTIWDGGDMLFDFNNQANAVTPEDCFRESYREELEPGQYIIVLPMYIASDRDLILRQVLMDLGFITQ